jgi:hypothetical protein
MTMDPLWGTQLTNMMIANPYMFDPTQKSNQFSLYNNQRNPYPPTYNGVPTDAKGNPIQSFVDWQQANPGGMSINATPSQPTQPQQPDMMALRNAALTGQPGAALAYGANFAPQGSPPGIQLGYGQNFAAFTPTRNWSGNAAPAAAPAPQPQAPPNNWQAALNALSNPGRVTTPGATVALQTGYQPSGGVNQAFLQQAGAGQGMNQNFLSALRAIQGR